MILLRCAKLVSLGLLLAVTASAASAVSGKTRRVDLANLKFELPPVAFAFPATGEVAVTIKAPVRPGVAMGGGFRQQRGPYFTQLCGGWGSSYVDVLPRESKLADPVRAMGAAYRQCRAIAVGMLEPGVRVAEYPEGYFGDLVSEGVLRVTRFDVSDEAELGRLFALLVGSLGEPDEPYLWPDGPMGGTSLGEIRQESGFVPDLTFEFVGELPVRVEVSKAQQRVLVLAGGKWDVYQTNSWAVGAFEQFLTPEAGSEY